MKINLKSNVFWASIVVVLAVLLMGVFLYQGSVARRHEAVVAVQGKEASQLKAQCDMGLISPNVNLTPADNSSLCRRYGKLSGDAFYLEIADLLQQYEIAQRTGNYPDTCAHAAVIATKFLQEKNENMYVAWKSHQAADCRNMLTR